MTVAGNKIVLEMRITELGVLRAKCGIAQQSEFRVQAWTVDAGDDGDIDIEINAARSLVASR